MQSQKLLTLRMTNLHMISKLKTSELSSFRFYTKTVQTYRRAFRPVALELLPSWYTYNLETFKILLKDF